MLELDSVTVRYGDHAALDAVSVAVADGERLSVLGPSGAGKSTLLRAVSGLEPLAGGSIRWRGRDLAGVPVHARGVGLMFQDYVLFPHRDVAGHVAFGLRMRGDRPAAQRARVTEVLEMVGLRGYEPRRVTSLSGGEQQRVALARALAPEPELLMLDEPLGALDRALRGRLLDELSELFARLALTIIYVTHDRDEALALGDRVAVMRDGRIEALARPDELWRNPPSEWVARFLGLGGIVAASIDEQGRASGVLGEIQLPPPLPPVGDVRLLIRPDALRLDEHGDHRATVVRRAFRGDDVLLRVALAGSDAPLEVKVDGPAPALGDEVRLSIDPRRVVVLPHN